MLGIPYEGRIPDFQSPGPVEPVPPSVLHQRQLREEQDQAYHESLLVHSARLWNPVNAAQSVARWPSAAVSCGAHNKHMWHSKYAMLEG